MNSEITRREALRRAAWLLGGTVSAPTILGVLAGVGSELQAAEVLRTLTPEQRAMVIAIAETIIPETDTPGARSARVDEFVDAMLTDHYPVADRERFLSGLAQVDARARRAYGKTFARLTPRQQLAMVSEMDRLAFTEPPPPDAADVGPRSFFRMMKELAVVGYYTSEAGSTRELRPMPWGRYRDIPYKPGTPAWA